MTLTRVRFALTSIIITCALVLLAAGQGATRERPFSDAAASRVRTRDNFGPQRDARPRLSRDELEKATEADIELEKGDETTDVARKAGSFKSRRRTPAAVPAHRLSRDVMLNSPASEATAGRGAKDWQITLKNSFIEKYKNRATLSTSYRVVAHRSHSAKEDGDCHVAGLTEDVGLACVAEIMNIKSFRGALTAVEDAEESQQLVKITGAWRLWCEHPDAVKATAGPQIQDDVIPEFTTSNPNHVFEIHPISRFGDLPLEDSFAPIPGYAPKEAGKAFRYYESIPCQIVPDAENQTTTLFTPKVVYNYVEFLLKLEEDQQFMTLDGRILRGAALDLHGEEQAQNRRMVFVKDTGPEKVVRSKKKDDTMHVLGIPRIDLALVSWRARMAETQPEALGWNLPYELIIVGSYEDDN